MAGYTAPLYTMGVFIHLQERSKVYKSRQNLEGSSTSKCWRKDLMQGNLMWTVLGARSLMLAKYLKTSSLTSLK